MARTPPPLGGVHWPWPLALAQGCSWLPSPVWPGLSHQRWSPAWRNRRDTKDAPISELSRSVWLQCGQRCASCAWLPLHCPGFMPCTRCART